MTAYEVRISDWSSDVCSSDLVHPQSVIHSLVEFRDHSTLAQLGAPDMRIPIAHALAWPERIATSCAPLDLVSIGRLDFEAPDEERFPAIRIAREASIEGGTCPAILKAAKEVEDEAFLKEKILFLEIDRIVRETLHCYSRIQAQEKEEIVEEE